MVKDAKGLFESLVDPKGDPCESLKPVIRHASSSSKSIPFHDASTKAYCVYQQGKEQHSFGRAFSSLLFLERTVFSRRSSLDHSSSQGTIAKGGPTKGLAGRHAIGPTFAAARTSHRRRQ